jgi:hypothetical protein
METVAFIHGYACSTMTQQQRGMLEKRKCAS